LRETSETSTYQPIYENIFGAMHNGVDKVKIVDG